MKIEGTVFSRLKEVNTSEADVVQVALDDLRFAQDRYFDNASSASISQAPVKRSIFSR